MQILIVQFDVFLSREEHINISIVYYCMQVMQLAYVFFIGPMVLLVYESDDTLKFVSFRLSRVVSPMHFWSSPVGQAINKSL